jgi:lytic murein transglycosylase
MTRLTAFTSATVLTLTLTASAFANPVPAMAAPVQTSAPANCKTTGSFDAWVEEFKRDAATQGISARVIADAAPYMQFDPDIIRKDRGQSVFQQTFLQFSERMVAPFRMQNGAIMLKRHQAILAKVEKDYGIPGSVLVAFWGLESDFGSNTGKSNIIRAISTLAFDCRRSDYFRTQLFDALRILEKGDLTIADMNNGDWAGELGALQFTASDYNKHAVDYDGDGKRDLVHSVPDVLASTANYLKSYGWKAGQRWNEGDPNFEAIRGWNKAMVYAKTIAAFAERLEGTSARAEEPRR